jgi:hypothetical protein
MGQGRHFPSLTSGILLIAVAIQGMAPDAQDISSPRAILLLCPILGDEHSFQDEDDSPDDVCEMAQLISSGLACHQRNDLRSSSLPPFVALGPLRPSRTRPLACNGGLDEPSLRLIDSLCCLRC